MFKFLKGKFKILARDDSLDLVAYPGDTLELTHTREYTDDVTGEIVWKESETILKEEIKEEIAINSAVAFEFEDAFEMKRGIGGAFGEKDD